LSDFDGEYDEELEGVVQALTALDPSGSRFANVFRETFDQLYDGQRTGRYKWEQLYKTEKTHYGTLIEINLQREFKFHDGEILDFQIAGAEIDCKYSFRDGGWMLPPESWDRLIMVGTASDERSTWSLGVVRVSESNRRTAVNRDGKTTLNEPGRHAIRWVFRDADLAPNVLLQLPEVAMSQIFAKKPGQARLDELFRQAEGRLIHRNTVATIAQQQDYMKRVRYNGGSRSNLQSEGYLILGGDYSAQRKLAAEFAVAIPDAGELISFRVVPSSVEDSRAVSLDGQFWRAAKPGEAVSVSAPRLTAKD
jgi:hypothetical protein